MTATIPEAVDAELVHELPEVLALLADVIGDENGLAPTRELAARIGWETKPFGEALRAAGVPSVSKRRMPGHDNPVSVADIDAIRQAIYGA